MVAYTPYVAVPATLSSLSYAPSLFPAHNHSAAICQLVTATVTEYAAAYPTTNPHGHGGPYYNPYNDVPLPYTWPGRPSHGETTPGPQPTTPYPYGGPARSAYEAPAWIPKGVHKLKPSLPKGKQNGNSNWGELDCPHLPLDGLPGGLSHSSYPLVSVSTPSVPYPTNPGSVSISSYMSHPTISESASYSSSYTKTISSSSVISSGAPTPNCHTMPNTGVTRTYDLHVAYQTIAPDGVTRNGITFNGQFPGPLVEANW